MTATERLKEKEKEYTELAVKFSALKEKDEAIRREMTKAFGWSGIRPTYLTRSDMFNEPSTPTWEEVFVQIGRLLESQKRMDCLHDVEVLKTAVQELRQQGAEDAHNA